MKTGQVTQVFKKERSNTDSKNCRGITFIPIITKILELIIRARIKSLILEKQNTLQRGFTDKSSPMNTALTLEEYIRDRKDSNLCWHDRIPGCKVSVWCGFSSELDAQTLPYVY